MNTEQTIVVGIDGSPYSREALRFAAEEAELRGGRLRVVCAWQVPISVQPAVGLTLVLDDDTAETLVRKELDQVFGSDPGVPVEVIVQEGNAAPVLIHHSRDAELLVVGSRGHGGFVGLLLGSVGQQCAVHARCPVVIVHPGETVESDADRFAPAGEER